MAEREVNGAPKKRIYKRRSPVQPSQEGPKHSSGLTPEDLAAFRVLAPKLSPTGQEIVALLIKVFNEHGELNPEQLLELINNFAGREKSSPKKSAQTNQLTPLLNMLPLLTSSLGNQGLNPTVLASLLSMLAANNSRD
ncbi:MAG: hypothetical protein GX050_06470 [Firmicutes bacterium]|nr:hypothetical protein [Bacillota bacterium]